MLDFFERHLLAIMVASGLIAFAAVSISVARSDPPREFTILTGRAGGAYYEFARQYQQVAAQYGFDLKIEETAGAVETLRKLEAGEAQVGFVQGGIARRGNVGKLNTLANLFYEPIWILYHKGSNLPQTPDELAELKGLRIGIGEPGSGTNVLARQLLDDVGLDTSNSVLVEESSQAMAEGLRKGDLDVAIFVSSLSSPLIQQLVVDPELELMNIRRAAAYSRRYPYLTSLTLPEGSLDLENNKPDQDVQMISTVANLVVNNEIHPDLLRLLTIAVVRTHEQGSLLDPRFEFPNEQYADLPVSKEGTAYLNRIKSGESILDNYFPFRLAALIDRYLIFVVPVVFLLFPLLSRSPLLYQFATRNRINRWYQTVREIELRADKTRSADIDGEIESLHALDDRLIKELNVGTPYMPDVYSLRVSIDFVTRRLERRKLYLQREAQQQTAAASPTNGTPADTPADTPAGTAVGVF